MRSELLKWRVQWRKDKSTKWQNAGLFETSEAAHQRATNIRKKPADFGVTFYLGSRSNVRVVRREVKIK